MHFIVLQVKHCIEELQVSEEKVSMLYTYTAITSFISRHLFCKLGDFRYFNRYYLYQGGTTIGGLCILCLPAARSFVPVLILLMGFGLMEGAMNGQISLLLLDCVGHHKLNRAWGYTMLFAGISAGVGPPLVGKFKFKPILYFQKVKSRTVVFNHRRTYVVAVKYQTNFRNMTVMKKALNNTHLDSSRSEYLS